MYAEAGVDENASGYERTDNQNYELEGFIVAHDVEY